MDIICHSPTFFDKIYRHYLSSDSTIFPITGQIFDISSVPLYLSSYKTGKEYLLCRESLIVRKKIW